MTVARTWVADEYMNLREGVVSVMSVSQKVTSMSPRFHTHFVLWRMLIMERAEMGIGGNCATF